MTKETQLNNCFLFSFATFGKGKHNQLMCPYEMTMICPDEMTDSKHKTMS